MKKLEQVRYNAGEVRQQLTELFGFLQVNGSFDEQRDFAPFLKARQQLAARIGTLGRIIVEPDCMAREYDVFGDFVADLVVGDSQEGAYTFIEFEDAQPNSLFVQKSSKYKSEFAPRFERGYSQLVDWFYKLDSMQGTRDMEERFGRREIRYDGVLVIGRNEFINPAERARLSWRQECIVVNSRHILVYTSTSFTPSCRARSKSAATFC